MKSIGRDISKERVFKIVIPVLIIIGIAIVWKIKNPGSQLTQKKGSEQNTQLQQKTDQAYELHVTDEIDLEHLKSLGLPIVIDFGADECDPCKEMAPVLENLNETLNNKAIILFVDVWKYPELARNYPVEVIPTQVFIDRDGNPYVPSEVNIKGMTMYSTKDTKEHIFTTHRGGITEELLLEILYEMGMEE